MKKYRRPARVGNASDPIDKHLRRARRTVAYAGVGIVTGGSPSVALFLLRSSVSVSSLLRRGLRQVRAIAIFEAAPCIFLS